MHLFRVPETVMYIEYTIPCIKASRGMRPRAVAEWVQALSWMLQEHLSFQKRGWAVRSALSEHQVLLIPTLQGTKAG